jgi:diguanylate cyclase (GGDEF)-like protein
MHKLLLRQLKRHDLQDYLEQKEPKFCKAVSDAYAQHEQTLKMLERSLYITSNELNERNQSLKKQVESMARVQAELEHSIGALNATFDATGEMILVYNSAGILSNLNSMGKRLLTSIFDEVNVHWHEFLSVLKDPAYIQSLVDELKVEPNKYLTGTIEVLDGRVFEFRSQPLLQQDELLGRVWCFQDVTLQLKHEKQIEYQAFHDALTGLPNRALLLDRIEHASKIADREKSKVAVLFLDLDDFKKVNDTEGHEAGDALLKMVAEKIKNSLREQDTLSRLGGDEFVVLLEGIKGTSGISDLCERLIESLTQPFQINGRAHFIGTSIGISCYPDDDISPEPLLRKADMAMYQAKNAGKNDFKFYDRKYELQMLDRVSLENSLREAIKREELMLVYQPKVDLKTMQISGVEALIRWPQADGTFISPVKFISIAEQSGLILDIGRIVITKSCEQLAQWLDAGYRDINMAFNLSSIEFQNTELIEHLINCMDVYSIPGENLTIELTESIFLSDKDSANKVMRRLHKLGITFALDDFGKGYSSFNYLQTLPIQYLKIDKAFLQDVEKSTQSAAITQTIIDIGRNLGLRLVAEGIEDEFMLEYSKQRNVAYGQGFFLHRPLYTEQVSELLAKQCNEK